MVSPMLTPCGVHGIFFCTSAHAPRTLNSVKKRDTHELLVQLKGEMVMQLLFVPIAHTLDDR